MHTCTYVSLRQQPPLDQVEGDPVQLQVGPHLREVPAEEDVAVRTMRHAYYHSQLQVEYGANPSGITFTCKELSVCGLANIHALIMPWNSAAVQTCAEVKRSRDAQPTPPLPSLAPDPHADRVELLWEVVLVLLQDHVLPGLLEHHQELIPSACHTAVHLVMDSLPLCRVLLEDYHALVGQACRTAAQEGHQVTCSEGGSMCEAVPSGLGRVAHRLSGGRGPTDTR